MPAVTSSALLSVPLPFVTAVLACVVAVRLAVGAAGNRVSRALFAGLFALFALEAILVGLRFGYGVESLIPIQRVLPLLVGPLMYCGFRALVEPPAQTRATTAHFGVALALIAACLLSRAVAAWLDLLIAASYCAYLVLLVRLWRRGPDVFAGASLSRATALHAWLFRSILLLALILALDSLISLDFMLSGGRQAALLIAVGSLLLIPAFVAAALLLPLEAPRVAPPASDSKEGATPEDRALADSAAELLARTHLYRDPDLSLSRLARRLGVPARRLSSAINIVHGVNVSQFVNERRVEDAAARLARSSDSLSDVMTAAGFLTRSNFYREFRRVHGVSPAEYRKRASP